MLIKILIFVFINVYFMMEAALPSVCPGVRNGYTGNPNNCSQYLTCLNSQVVAVGACPKNLYFSANRTACVPRHMTNCSDNHHHFRSKRDTSNEAAFDCTDKSDGFYSDLERCGSYFECRNGSPASGDCVGDYEWNSETNQCDVPQKSDCTKKRESLLPNSTASPPNLTDHSKDATTTILTTTIEDIEITTTESSEKPVETSTLEAVDSTTTLGDTDSTTQNTTEKEINTTTEEEINTTTTSETETVSTTQEERIETTPVSRVSNETTTTEIDIDEPSTDSDEIDVITTDAPLSTESDGTTTKPEEPTTESEESTTVSKETTTQNSTSESTESSTNENSSTEIMTTQKADEESTTNQPQDETTSDPQDEQTTTQEISSTTQSVSSTTEQAPSSTTTQPPSTTTLDPICKGETDKKIVDPLSCNQYFECDENGVSTKKKCEPAFLRYHRQWKACVPSFLVHCKVKKKQIDQKKQERRARSERIESSKN